MKNNMKEVKVKKNAAPASKKMGVVRCKITNNKTVSTSHKGVKKNWILIDAQDAVVGRLAAYLVHHLTGKHLASYTPHTDDGDKIVVINCDKVKFTGNKEEDKIYRRHSDYVGGMKEFSAKEIRSGKKPCDLLRITVQRMLGRCKMNYKVLSKNLYLYAGAEHCQSAQNPVLVKFSELNRKNVVK